MKSFRITHCIEIVIFAKDEEQALKDAYWEEFKAIDELEFTSACKVVEE